MALFRNLLMLLAVLAFVPGERFVETQPATPRGSTYVLVHGAWGGGWAWRDVESRLRARGHAVYRPTLTGLGERVHLANGTVGLETHITDVVNVIRFENLEDIVLMGHSYGGMVITGVADRVPERIRRLIYVDAMVPESGESVEKLAGPDGLRKMPTKDGAVVPAWLKPDQPLPHDVPHPLKSFTDVLTLSNPAAKTLPARYILTMDPGKTTDGFSRYAERAKARGWTVVQMEADHNPQWSKPAELVELLLK
jgi:pimeloyl-ACP methyl ester carboxylesterase